MTYLYWNAIQTNRTQGGIKMYLKYIQVVNFRNNRKGIFEFCKGANTVIGENDAGKTNAMTAIRILLDSDYYYTTKRLQESDFSNNIGDWKGHWIIISAFFDEITKEDQDNDVCSEINPDKENEEFLRSFIRCEGKEFGTVTLFIRPNIEKRRALFNAQSKEEFEKVRLSIKLSDYEFYYTARSQVDFTEDSNYKKIVGDFEKGEYANPDLEDEQLIGGRTDILNIWQHVSVEYIDALRDVEAEMRKNKNPLRRIFETVQSEIADDDVESIIQKVNELNQSLSQIKEVKSIGNEINRKLQDIVGLVYSPEIAIESTIKEDIISISRFLSLSTPASENIDFLGLGHLNILYIALKIVEFERNRNHEILNVMIVEEPEAHIHTHIQRALFENLKISQEYTQVIMTTHSTHISDVSNIRNMNVLKIGRDELEVMHPSKGLNEFGERYLNLGLLNLSQCLERYLDAKRSVLLFSKGVILVEGDAEEILIPALVKVVLGITLDELGIGLVNVGSVSFEYVASVFANERIRRYCAILTDSDATVKDAKKSSINAENTGKSRKEKLDRMYGDNIWVEAFYAPHTFEVDFASIGDNRQFLKDLVDISFKNEKTIQDYKSEIDGSEAQQYDATLKLAKRLGKGWMATLLAQKVNYTTKIPDYIIEALVFASQEVISNDLKLKMIGYSLEQLDESVLEVAECKKLFKSANIAELENKFVTNFPENDLSKYLNKLVERGVLTDESFRKFK